MPVFVLDSMIVPSGSDALSGSVLCVGKPSRAVLGKQNALGYLDHVIIE